MLRNLFRRRPDPDPPGYRPDVVPAECDNGHAFWPATFVMGGETGRFVVSAKLQVRTGPCPSCGAMGSIPRGTYVKEDRRVRRIAEESGG